MTLLTLEGFKLERSNPRLPNFFHQIVEQFGIVRVLILRAMFDLMALYFFVSSAYRLALDYNPDLAMNIKTFYPAVGLIGFFLSGLYYKPLKALMKTKQEAFSN